MTIWFNKNYQVGDLKKFMHSYMGDFVGIEFTELGPDFLKGTMPVNEKTRTPFGLLHGGASCVLAETLGSCASALCIDLQKQAAVGIEINANHIKAVRSGLVTGVAKAVHVGRSIHVWDIRITNAEDKLACVSRLTIKVLDKES